MTQTKTWATTARVQDLMGKKVRVDRGLDAMAYAPAGSATSTPATSELAVSAKRAPTFRPRQGGRRSRNPRSSRHNIRFAVR